MFSFVFFSFTLKQSPLFFQERQPFERIEVTREQALEMFADNSFKASKLLVFEIVSDE